MPQDVIEGCEGPELLRALYHAISTITILDPTCGSGAFLFAALNILEPLYQACLERMESFIADADALKSLSSALSSTGGSADRPSTKKRIATYNDFRRILKEVQKHPNEGYYVFKSIILNTSSAWTLWRRPSKSAGYASSSNSSPKSIPPHGSQTWE